MVRLGTREFAMRSDAVIGGNNVFPSFRRSPLTKYAQKLSAVSGGLYRQSQARFVALSNSPRT